MAQWGLIEQGRGEAGVWEAENSGNIIAAGGTLTMQEVLLSLISLLLLSLLSAEAVLPQ